MTSRVANVYAAIIIPVPAATLALALRFKARRMTRMGTGYDDVFAVAAWVLAMGYTIDLIVWTRRFRLGRRLASLSPDAISFYLERGYLILWISELLYAWSIFLAKMAVLFFYRRIFRFSSIRVPIVVLMVACAAWVVVRTFFTILHCVPPRAFWDKSVPGARCVVNVRVFYLATDIAHCCMDFLILALPIYEVARMRLPLTQKVAVVCLFAMGSLVGIASVFQIVHSQEYNPADQELPYELALAMAWGNVELHLAVFIGSLALLRPIFRKFVPGFSSRSRSASAPRPADAVESEGPRDKRSLVPGIFHRGSHSAADHDSRGVEAASVL